MQLHVDRNIYVYTAPVDFRKSIDGLSIMLQELFNKNPQSGDTYLFTNREHNKIKCLVWDKNGFILYYKRLERGRFNYSKYLCDNEIVITEQQLKALLMGLDFYLLGEYVGENYEDFF